MTARTSSRTMTMIAMTMLPDMVVVLWEGVEVGFLVVESLVGTCDGLHERCVLSVDSSGRVELESWESLVELWLSKNRLQRPRPSIEVCVLMGWEVIKRALI
jgi:hypothetical protein